MYSDINLNCCVILCHIILCYIIFLLINSIYANFNYTIEFDNQTDSSVNCILNYDGKLYKSVIVQEILPLDLGLSLSSNSDSNLNTEPIDLKKLINIIELISKGKLHNYSVKFLHKIIMPSDLTMVIEYNCGSGSVNWTKQIYFTEYEENILEKYHRRLRQEGEKLKKEQDEREQKINEIMEEMRLEGQEEIKLLRILDKFNSKDLPTFNVGCNVRENYIRKFQFTLEELKELKKLKKFNLNELVAISIQLHEDLIWIQKYVYGNENTNPFVDYIYDNYIENNKVLNIIDDLKKKIKKISKSDYNYSYSSAKSKIFQKQIKGLLCLTNHFDTQMEYDKLVFKVRINKPREYYYINYEEFLDLFDTDGKRDYKNFIFSDNLASDCIILDKTNEECLAYKYYFHPWHIWDRAKLEKLSFLKITNKFIKPIEYVCSNSHSEIKSPNYFYLMEQDIILSRKEISQNKYNCIRTQPIDDVDFDKFSIVAQVIIKLIEFIMQE